MRVGSRTALNRTARRLAVAVTGAALVAAGLSGCATGSAAAAQAHVVVHIAPSSHPADYEVRVAQADGGFRATSRMRSGQTRTFTVPPGWLTVRVPGVCVVPAAASGTTTVRIGVDACGLA